MTSALPGFHAFSGADQTGHFAGKGKLTCWQTLKSLFANTSLVQILWRLVSSGGAEKLPPTQGALHQANARAHYQAMVWDQDHVPNPQMPPATDGDPKRWGSK